MPSSRSPTTSVRERPTIDERLAHARRRWAVNPRCRHGHEYTPDNTYTYWSPRDWIWRRLCLTCAKLHMREVYRARRDQRENLLDRR